jgi:hypothetical protein
MSLQLPARRSPWVLVLLLLLCDDSAAARQDPYRVLGKPRHAV